MLGSHQVIYHSFIHLVIHSCVFVCLFIVGVYFTADGSLDFDMWFEKGVESDDVVSGQPFKLSTSGNLTLMVWIGLLTDTSNGTVFKIKNKFVSVCHILILLSTKMLKLWLLLAFSKHCINISYADI